MTTRKGARTMAKAKRKPANSVAEGLCIETPAAPVAKFVVIGNHAVVVDVDGVQVEHRTGDVVELELTHAGQLVVGGHVWAITGDSYRGVGSLMDPSQQAELLDPGMR